VSVRSYLSAIKGFGSDDIPLTEEERVRRVAILCRHCLRNLAFYRAGWRYNSHSPRVNRQFWIAAHGSFIDIAVLEWCKLFADEKKGRHHWQKVVADGASFEGGLYDFLRLTKEEFAEYTESMRHFRDKFVAHLDDKSTAFIPFVWPARRSAAYLYGYLQHDAELGGFLADLTETASDFYASMYRLAYREYLAGGRTPAVRIARAVK
jgi:hypothetical protein